MGFIRINVESSRAKPREKGPQRPAGEIFGTKIAPLGHSLHYRWGGRIFWPKAGILVRRRSLGKSKKAYQVPENRTFLRLRR